MRLFYLLCDALIGSFFGDDETESEIEFNIYSERDYEFTELFLLIFNLKLN